MGVGGAVHVGVETEDKFGALKGHHADQFLLSKREGHGLWRPGVEPVLTAYKVL